MVEAAQDATAAVAANGTAGEHAAAPAAEGSADGAASATAEGGNGISSIDAIAQEALAATPATAPQNPSGGTGFAGTPAATVAPPVQRPKVLVVGDENLLFTSGMQEAYQDWEFTAASCLSRQNLEIYNFDPNPSSLRGRSRMMVDPCRVAKHFQNQEFDGMILFLPGLSFLVPPELGTADRPLFAYRMHLFAFHIVRNAKLLLKTDAKIHLLWPEENGLMTSPCGAAGIEMPNLMTFCGCKPVEPVYSYDKVEEGWFMPFIFGEVPQPTPEWLTNLQMLSYSIDRSPIAVPLSVALLLHPDINFVSIKDPSTEPTPPPPTATSLRACLIHEANARRHRLKEIFTPKESGQEAADAFGLVPEPVDEDSLLAIPMEIFMTSFDDIPHISQIMRFKVMEDQPQLSVASLDMLDPRLPTRIARPPPSKPNPLGVVGPGGKKRMRPQGEDWGGMRFHCTLTKICAPTAERMRHHMNGELYKRMAAATPSWETSQEKAMLLEMLQEAEQLEQQQQRARRAGPGGKGGKRGK
eukprot:TRINITY_DN37342_c0_g1_i1.p1 TRINITY_DN37342_c0_g1~~TRINITY_DN37342_c0_g1_i1.p1  ORF type:complete len:526 (-),score=148.30 TRINITY_DN37342_c0_g1_i1:105-1682(-)